MIFGVDNWIGVPALLIGVIMSLVLIRELWTSLKK